MILTGMSTIYLTEKVTDWNLSEEDFRYPYPLRMTPMRLLCWNVYDTDPKDWWGNPTPTKRFAIPNYPRERKRRKRPCKGEILMRRMGWRRGEGLGKKGEGRLEPIQPIRKQDRRGIGYYE